jgi:ATP-dependent DNA helicase RecQ
LSNHNIHNILKEYWGYPAFRPLQEDIINSILAGKDTLALLPTGGGKSLCFQIPGIALGGITIVVSPLVALMKDQVEQLKQRDISALAIYSGMPFREIDLELDNCINGKYQFLYVSPERLQTEIFLARVEQMPVKLIAVDEAHCISQWGYDFRPEYLEIKKLREVFPQTPVIALTATATPDVVKDIQTQLQFKTTNVCKSSFERENLHYLVLNIENKAEQLPHILHQYTGSTIIYVRSRYQTQKIAYELQQKGFSATYYHAGLKHTERSQRQNDWTVGKTQIIVATNAFGMGIDKPDVRLVVHIDLPETLENYFQEAGRAGRDGKDAYCIILYSEADRLQVLEKFEHQRTDATAARKILDSLHSFYNIAHGTGDGLSFDFDIQPFSERFGMHPVPVYAALKAIEQQGIIALTENVYIPSKIKFKVNNYTLYEYQIKYPVITEFVKTILRSYGGAFEQYTPINELELSRRTNSSKADIIKGLEKLKQHDIIDYHPHKELPQLTFLFPRGIEKIDAKAIDQRTVLSKQKLETVINYAQQTEKCRQQIVLAYFSETDSLPCGKCDICIETAKKISSIGEFEDYRTNIEAALANGAQNIVALSQSMGIEHQKKLTDTIRRMVESEELILKDGWVSLNEKRK